MCIRKYTHAINFSAWHYHQDKHVSRTRDHAHVTTVSYKTFIIHVLIYFPFIYYPCSSPFFFLF